MQVLLLTSLMAAGCVSEIEPAGQQPNYPPYIDPAFVQPTREVIRVDDNEVQRLSVEAFLDPNPEERLYYAWIGKRLGLIEQHEVALNLEQRELFKGIFYQFGRVETEIDPCSERLRSVDNETIWIYVADRRFVRLTANAVEVEEGGFIDSHSWVFEFSPTRCQQINAL